MNRPVPLTGMVWVAPVAVVVEKIGVQLFTPSGETWIWNALACAVCQTMTTWQMAMLAPRSTWSHCGSLKALDQRVPASPSAAFAAAVPAFSVDEAVVGRPSATLAAPPPPPVG